MKASIFHLGLFTAAVALSCPLSAQTADAASDIDKTFVGKVSQGGMYEVEASKVAAQKATAQDVKDMAAAEVHDHTLVNDELKKIATTSGVDVDPHLDAAFQQRLDKLKKVSRSEFDLVYADDMAQIHDMDEKLFAQEAIDGSGEFKAFAGKTDSIVKRHIGAIHGADPQ
jgi:putative membrane protein